MENLKFNVECRRVRKTNKYELAFLYNVQLIERIRHLPETERKFEKSTKLWNLTFNSLYELIKSYKNSDKIFFDFKTDEKRDEFRLLIKKYKDSEVDRKLVIENHEKLKASWVEYKEHLENEFERYSEHAHSFLKEGVKLYPHQIIGTLFTNKVNNVLLALDMGLGKTISSILSCEMMGFSKVIVITPNSLKFNYMGEVEKFTNSKAHVIGYKKNKHTLEESKYLIINYDFFNSSDKNYALSKWEKLNIGKINALILDESHRIKNSASNICKNITRIFKNDIFNGEKKYTVYMSGTPAVNKTQELYTILHEISPLDFPTKKHFYEYYCGMEYDPYNYGWSVKGEGKYEELFYKIAPFVFRKKIEDVIKDLPDKRFEKIVFELNDKQLKTYNDIEWGFYNDFTLNAEKNPLTAMLRLRQFTSECKISYMCELIDSILETDEKIVIFDVFKDSLYKIYEKYKDVAILHTGDQSVEERSEAIKIFQDKMSDKKIFLSTFSSGNYGITLTAATKLFLMTLPYSLGEYKQAVARIYRIGQKNNVIIYPLMFLQTIDEYVYSSIEGKQKEVSKVIDNEEYESNVDESVLGEVLKTIKSKYS